MSAHIKNPRSALGTLIGNPKSQEIRDKSAKIFFLITIVYTLASLFIYGFLPSLQSLAFPMLGTIRMLPSFADLRWVSALSECSIDLEDLAAGKLVGCDPWKRGGLNYPPLSVEIARAIHVNGGHTGLLGFAFGAATVCILLSMINRVLPAGWRRDLYAGLLVMSFPLQLALERCNIDIVVFLLLCALAAWLTCNRIAGIPLAAFTSFIVVGIKLYPAAGIISWSALSLLKRPRLDWWRSAAISGAAIGLAMTIPWYLRYGKYAPQPLAGTISHSFIVPFSDHYLTRLKVYLPSLITIKDSSAQTLFIAISAILFAASFISSMCLRLSSLWQALLACQVDEMSRRFFKVTPSLLGCTWLSCYFLSGSFDYRLTLFFPLFISLLAVQESASQNCNLKTSFFMDVTVLAGFATFLLPNLLAFCVNMHLPYFSPIIHASILASDLILLPIVAAAATALILDFSSTDIAVDPPRRTDNNSIANPAKTNSTRSADMVS